VSRSQNPFDRLAELLAYPGPDLACNAEEVRDLLAATDPAAARCIESFLAHVETLSRAEREELYTRTFDLNPVCALEIGWHLYGEAYERGAFLVRMRELLRRAGLAEGIELPDHLTSALPAFGRMEAPEAAAFATEFLLPALDKMLAGLEDNPYEPVLRAIHSLAALAAGTPIATQEATA
jgi:nitrate reductase delta subunit